MGRPWISMWYDTAKMSHSFAFSNLDRSVNFSTNNLLISMCAKENRVFFAARFLKWVFWLLSRVYNISLFFFMIVFDVGLLSTLLIYYHGREDPEHYYKVTWVIGAVKIYRWGRFVFENGAHSNFAPSISVHSNLCPPPVNYARSLTSNFSSFSLSSFAISSSVFILLLGWNYC